MRGPVAVAAARVVAGLGGAGSAVTLSGGAVPRVGLAVARPGGAGSAAALHELGELVADVAEELHLGLPDALDEAHLGPDDVGDLHGDRGQEVEAALGHAHHHAAKLLEGARTRVSTRLVTGAKFN